MYTPQVAKEHYTRGSYRTKDRWLSYWYQLTLIRELSPRRVLEIGPGEGVVTHALRAEGIEVTTCDIARDLSPDVVASVTKLPFPGASFDVVLAAEVLEHIRFEDVADALREIARVSRIGAVVSLPHPGHSFACEIKIPLFPRRQLLVKIPFFWKRHQFNGEHYWELGKRGYPASRFIACARAAGLRLAWSQSYTDDPAHRFFVFYV